MVASTFKAQVALAAVKGDKALSELASLHGVHPTMIHTWKKQLLDHAEDIFQSGAKSSSAEHEALQAQLYEQIGRLKTELDWLKKKLPASVERKRAWVDPADALLSVSEQCELLGLGRSSYYFEPATESAANLTRMALIDKESTDHPFRGSRAMRTWLRQNGHAVNRKRVQRLMRLMGLEAVVPKPRLSVGAAGHKLYPYLLRGVEVERADQVWSTDIT
jgi:putative transposase